MSSSSVVLFHPTAPDAFPQRPKDPAVRDFRPLSPGTGPRAPSRNRPDGHGAGTAAPRRRPRGQD
ncbi:hypothetical protein J2S55_007124 [Streptosporangium brasiliense]|uniref:Uncharacterized protein n=1 Tax=Streptosporangium brasiliense TaxID=47480 RepID=A0ABT9RF00_9ACTN|nr:hypothetical protein [Streptosporangium brasiliense]